MLGILPDHPEAVKLAFGYGFDFFALAPGKRSVEEKDSQRENANDGGGKMFPPGFEMLPESEPQRNREKKERSEKKIAGNIIASDTEF